MRRIYKIVFPYTQYRDKIIELITQAVAQITFQIRQTDKKIDYLERELHILQEKHNKLQNYILHKE